MTMIARKQDPAVTVRFPRNILDKVTQAAKASGRSRNSEVLVRLAQSLGVKLKSLR